MDRLAEHGYPAIAYAEILKATDDPATILSMLWTSKQLGLTHYVDVQEDGTIVNRQVP